jgi:hypothetical protein
MSFNAEKISASIESAIDFKENIKKKKYIYNYIKIWLKIEWEIAVKTSCVVVEGKRRWPPSGGSHQLGGLT